MLTDLELANAAYAAYVAEVGRHIPAGSSSPQFAALSAMPRARHAAWLEAVRAVRREIEAEAVAATSVPLLSGKLLHSLWNELVAQQGGPSSRWSVSVATISWAEMPPDAQAAWDELASRMETRTALAVAVSTRTRPAPGPGEHPPGPEDGPDLPADGTRGPVTLGRQAYEAFCATVSATESSGDGAQPVALAFASWTSLPSAQRLAWNMAAAKVSRISERLTAERRPAALRHACGAVCAEPGEDICVSAGATTEHARDIDAKLARAMRHECPDVPGDTCRDPDAHLVTVPDDARRSGIIAFLTEMDELEGLSAGDRVHRAGYQALVRILAELSDTIGETLT